MCRRLTTALAKSFNFQSWAPVNTIEETESYKCRTFMQLNYNLEMLSAEIEGLRWPNAEFRQVLSNMVR